MALRKIAWEEVKDKVCLEDKEVLEDIDLAMHLSQIGNVRYDHRRVVTSSLRRWKKIVSYFEYPSRYIKTMNKHREAMHPISPEKLTKKLLPASGKLIKKSLQRFSEL